VSTIEQHHQLETADNIAAPKPSLRLVDAIALIVGLVIGAGIFETPALVAANADSQSAVLQVWAIGGAISTIGALCYAELATTYPYVGGSYDYLKRAFGQPIAILFAWARMSVIQTGSIALLAFVFGDYASQLWALARSSAFSWLHSEFHLCRGLVGSGCSGCTTVVGSDARRKFQPKLIMRRRA
jgi:APA family basic amino acid/polyamine antiporter